MISQGDARTLTKWTRLAEHVEREAHHLVNTLVVPNQDFERTLRLAVGRIRAAVHEAEKAARLCPAEEKEG